MKDWPTVPEDEKLVAHHLKTTQADHAIRRAFSRLVACACNCKHIGCPRNIEEAKSVTWPDCSSLFKQDKDGA